MSVSYIIVSQEYGPEDGCYLSRDSSRNCGGFMFAWDPNDHTRATFETSAEALLALKSYTGNETLKANAVLVYLED